jgi:hypothetical protein
VSTLNSSAAVAIFFKMYNSVSVQLMSMITKVRKEGGC